MISFQLNIKSELCDASLKKCSKKTGEAIKRSEKNATNPI